MNRPNMPEIDNTNAVSIYGQDDAMDDFPVLKAFQQYIDAEQAKARKRLVSLGIFFGILMGAVIAVFLVMLMNISQRNQALNDRLIEFAMKERDRQGPVVVQPPVQQDNAAILSLTSKLEEMQQKLMESQKKSAEAERAHQAEIERAKAEAAATLPKPPSPEQLEIQRLNALLKEEKEKAAVKAAEEKARLKELELEAYRRKHYPELYAPAPQPLPARKVTREELQPVVDPAVEEEEEPVVRKQTRRPKARKLSDQLDDLEAILNDSKAISYFDDDEEESPSSVEKPAERPQAQPQPTKEPFYQIPVKVKGANSTWLVPND